MSFLGSSWRPGRSTRSCSGPARRWPRRTRGWSRRSSGPRSSTSTRPAGRPRASAAPSGARSPARPLCSGSRPEDTPPRHRPCSASATGGIVCSDRYGGYDYLDPTRRQLCWAHLLRDFTAHSEGMGEQAQFGAAGLAVATDLFNAWQQFQHDDNHARLRRRIKPLQARNSARNSSMPRARAPAPGTTASSPATCSNAGPPSGPSPTPTASSRPTTTPNAASAAQSSTANSHSALNPNEANARIERLLSASITCRLRHQSLFAYLTQVITAHARGDPIPSLS